MIWKAKDSNFRNRMYKNKGNGVYAYNSVITAMKSNSFNGNGKAGTGTVCKGLQRLEQHQQTVRAEGYGKEHGYNRKGSW